ncbi:nose resistant to fluoxetine protein 6-like [Amblyomma americanum]|uniref:Nose resistant-to-fluoxetine protein N-terminal domain-containing protein n=1 Tax=Amblyomma americanum TaxID=6943 RepID=A0AAQ4ESM2_AMBAM
MALGSARCSRGLLLLLFAAASSLVSAQLASDRSTGDVADPVAASGTTAMTTRTTTTTTPQPVDLLKETLDSISERAMRIAMKELYPMVSELIYDPRLSPGCIGSLMKIGPALRNFEIWAVEMVDAMGKPQAGMALGRIAMYGQYDECLGIRHHEGLFQGRYCMVHLSHDASPMPPTVVKAAEKFMKHHKLEYIGNVSEVATNEITTIVPLLKYGACVPSVCQQEDVQVIIDHLVGDLKVNLKAAWCKIDEPVRLDQRQTLIVCIFVLWTAFILFGTAYDIYRTVVAAEDAKLPKYNAFMGLVHEAVQSVSLRRAFKKLMEMPNWGDYSNKLGFIHGVRVFSATWVVLGHSHMLRDLHANSNMIRLLRRVQEDFLFTVQLNSFMAVETFLAITGFLSGYLVAKAHRVDVSPLLLYIVALVRRYIRLMVPMAALLGFVYLIPAIVDGPPLHDYWPLLMKPCDKNWWKIFTMSQNYMDDYKDLCMPHYWYISMEYQLAIYSTIILVAIFPRWPKVALWLMGASVAATCLTTGIQVYINNYTPFNVVFTTDVQRIIDSSMNIYIKAYTHAPPMFIGMIFGCLAVRRNQLSRLIQGAAWALAATVSLAALLGVRTWFDGRQPERLESAFYAALHRASWSLGASWVMYACATGHGGFVNKILAWPVLYPLGRLSFSVYLVHVILMGCNAVLSRENISQQPFLQAQAYLSMAIMSYVLGSIVYLFIECPVAGLENALFSKIIPKKAFMSDNTKFKDENQELKAIQVSSADAAGKTWDVALPKHECLNGFPDVTKNAVNGSHLNGYVNSACESEFSEKDTAPGGSVVTVKF